MRKVQHAFGYVRVSVDEDGGNNASIAAQAAAIRAHAKHEGIEIVEIFEDVNVSGRSTSRKQFDRMMALATSPERPVDIIIVYALSRFARRLLTQVTAEHKLAEARVGLVSLTEGFSDDPSGRMMRSIVAVINEKYALDASDFTRRDRRGNAERGFFNGGPVPLGYEARTALVEGKKERRKLFIQEEEAAVVRLIFDLALRGLGGQPMGTRAIAEHLNAGGHRLRGHTFMHSSVDGILKRQHYAGFYLDRTGDTRGIAPTDEEAIRVPCPQIIDPAVIAQVAARRAAASPRVTPPRVTNSPVALTGIARCAEAGCGAGLTIRTGKGGRYGYYTCNAKATAGAAACSAKPIRQDELDGIVTDLLLERILDPVRLKQLLAKVIERSDGADERRRGDLERVRRELGTAEQRLGRLLELIEDGHASARDRLIADRLAEHRQTIARLEASRRSLELQLSSDRRRIDEATVERFGRLLASQLRDGHPALRRNYVRLFVSEVRVTRNAIVVLGTPAALEAAIAATGQDRAPTVPSFDRKWCRLQDSNL